MSEDSAPGSAPEVLGEYLRLTHLNLVTDDPLELTEMLLSICLTSRQATFLASAVHACIDTRLNPPPPPSKRLAAPQPLPPHPWFPPL